MIMAGELNKKRNPYFSDILVVVSSLIYATLHLMFIALGFQEPLTPLAIPLSLLLASVALFTLLARKRLGRNIIVLAQTTLGLALSLSFIDYLPRHDEHLRFLLNPYYAIAFTVLFTAGTTYFGIMKKRGWI